MKSSLTLASVMMRRFLVVVLGVMLAALGLIDR